MPRNPLAGVRDSGPLTRQSRLVAAVCLLVDCLSFCIGSSAVHSPVLLGTAVVAIMLVDAALASAPRLSGAVVVAQAGVAIAFAAALPQRTPIVNDAGMVISAYRAGAWLPRRGAAAALLILTVGIPASRYLKEPDLFHWHIALVVMRSALLPWLVGRYTTARRAYIAELQQRSERKQRDAQQAMADAIAEERTAIARDLHDVIAHHVSAIGVHAGAARLAIAASPCSGNADLTRSLAAVEKSSRAAMLDLRRMLDLLHGNRGDRVRQPGLANLDELLDAVGSAGLEVRLTCHNIPLHLPESMDLALYRVIQEMLTNALRHGDGGKVELDFSFDGSAITATSVNPVCSDQPNGRRADSAHRGLQGMHSRTAMFNGSISYGLTADGASWTTTATFPLDHI